MKGICFDQMFGKHGRVWQPNLSSLGNALVSLLFLAVEQNRTLETMVYLKNP